MLNQKFYWGTIRKSIVAFGNLFNNIHIDRSNANGEVIQTLKVPLSYAPRQKFLARISAEPNLPDEKFQTIVPRMGFEMIGIQYDPNRRVSLVQQNRAVNNTTTTLNAQYAPTPYNIDINLYAYTKNQDDGLQIIEQILPFFSPELTMALKVVPESNIITDVPVILNSMSLNDEYDGDFETRRFVTYTLNFTIKALMFGPVTNASIINRVFVNTDQANLDAIGNTVSGDITSTWNEQ